MEERFFLVARKYPFDRDVEIFAPVFQNVFRNAFPLFFSYNHPNCRRKLDGGFMYIPFPFLRGSNKPCRGGGFFTCIPLPNILLMKSVAKGIPIDASIPRNLSYSAVLPPQTIPCPTRWFSTTFFCTGVVYFRLLCNRFRRFSWAFHFCYKTETCQRLKRSSSPRPNCSGLTRSFTTDFSAKTLEAFPFAHQSAQSCLVGKSSPSYIK